MYCHHSLCPLLSEERYERQGGRKMRTAFHSACPSFQAAHVFSKHFPVIWGLGEGWGGVWGQVEVGAALSTSRDVPVAAHHRGTLYADAPSHGCTRQKTFVAWFFFFLFSFFCCMWGCRRKRKREVHFLAGTRSPSVQYRAEPRPAEPREPRVLRPPVLVGMRAPCDR